MALITCPECGRQVSDKAAACPQCGYPINSTPVQSTATDDYAKYIMLARRARDEKNSTEASRYYSLAYEMKPFEWEPSFYKAFYQTLSGENVDAVKNAIPNVMKLISGITDEEEKAKASEQVYSDCLAYLDIISEGYMQSGRYESLLHSYSELGMTLLQNMPGELPSELVSRVINVGLTHAKMVNVGLERELKRYR